MIAHTAYFEALASIEDETSPEWKPTLAGLVVLRLVDDWLDFGAQVVTTDITGLRAVYRAVTDVSEGNPVRSILIGLVDTLEQAEVATIDTIASHLLAYGKALFYAGKWTMAEDIFITIRERAELVAQHEIVTQANLELAFLLRRRGSLDLADEAFVSVIRTAHIIGDLESELRGRFGRVSVIIDRGDLPKAEVMLEALIPEAESHGLTELKGRMLHERAFLCYLQENMNASVRFGYQALEYVKDSVTRDRILAHIAVSFAKMGYLQASRDANLILASTAQQEEVRWSAFINLMYVAILEDHELAFEQYRLKLERSPLPVPLEASYRLDAARGFFKFGHHELAEQELTKARQLAESNTLNQLIFEIEAVAAEQSASIQESAELHTWPADIISIASTIGEWRVLHDTLATKQTEGAAL